MKKVFYLAAAALLMGMSATANEIIADNQHTAAETAYAEIDSSTTGTTLPSSFHGPYFNNNNFVYVQNGWVRIVIGGNSREYNYSVTMDRWDNYILKLSNGDIITVYSNGRSLYYNDVTYSKR